MPTLDYQTPETPKPKSCIPFWLTFIVAFLFGCFISDTIEEIRQERRGHLNFGVTGGLIVFILPASFIVITIVKHIWPKLDHIGFSVLFGISFPVLAYLLMRQ